MNLLHMNTGFVLALETVAAAQHGNTIVAYTAKQYVVLACPAEVYVMRRSYDVVE